MNYKIILISIFLILTSCKFNNISKNINYDDNFFSNRGFALIYSEELIKKKKIKTKIDSRSLDINHDYLAKGTKVKITNLLNDKSIVANVKKKIDNLDFYNAIISQRISDELEININQPYIEIKEIKNNSIFLAKKSKTFDEEKNVANKAPVETISVNDLNSSNKKNLKTKMNTNFVYSIKVVDFYFFENAKLLKKNIMENTDIKVINILSISKNIHRITLGPYYNINSLKNDFYSIRTLGFENLEIIKND